MNLTKDDLEKILLDVFRKGNESEVVNAQEVINEMEEILISLREK